jgi:hypothetical protein
MDARFLRDQNGSVLSVSQMDTYIHLSAFERHIQQKKSTDGCFRRTRCSHILVCVRQATGATGWALREPQENAMDSASSLLGYGFRFCCSRDVLPTSPYPWMVEMAPVLRSLIPQEWLCQLPWDCTGCTWTLLVWWAGYNTYSLSTTQGAATLFKRDLHITFLGSGKEGGLPGVTVT